MFAVAENNCGWRCFNGIELPDFNGIMANCNGRSQVLVYNHQSCDKKLPKYKQWEYFKSYRSVLLIGVPKDEKVVQSPVLPL